MFYLMRNTTRRLEKKQSRTVARILRNPEEYAPLFAIRNCREYDTVLAHLNDLVDDVGDKSEDPRHHFIDTLRLLIDANDEGHHKISDASRV